jgi:hypothetical protein
MLIVSCSKSEKEVKILFDDASLLLKETSTKDSICSEAINKLRTIMIEYPKTKLAKTLELNVKKVFVPNYGLLTLSELI